MRNLSFILTLIAFLSFSSCGKRQSPSPDGKDTTERVDTTSMIVMQIQRCSRLYTTEIHVHKVVTHDDRLALKGKILSRDYDIPLPLGKRKVAIPVDATMKAYVDFSGFSAANVRRDSDHMEIILPDPHIVLTSSRVNHDDIKEYVALLRHDFTDEELSSYERQGRDAIIADIAKTDIMETARAGAANTLIPLLAQMGYGQENVVVTFRKDFTPKELAQLVDKSTVEKRNKH